MEPYPDSIRNAVYNLIRSGTTPNELIEQFGIAWGTAYRWMYELRAQGEDVSFLNASDRLKAKALERFAEGASVQTVHEELAVSRSTVYRWRDEYERQAPSDSVPPAREVQAAGKNEPSGVKRRKLAEPPKDVLIKQLKTALAEKTLEVDFFRGALREVKARRQRNTVSGETPSTVD